MTGKHLRSGKCTGVVDNCSTYKEKYDSPNTVSEVVAESRKRDEQTKLKQSKAMKAYYETDAGEKHKQMTASLSKQRMENGYRSEAAKHLREINRDPEMKRKRREKMLSRWEKGDIRDTVEEWHEDNRQKSLEQAAYARAFITDRMSGLHQRFKDLMNQKDLSGFESEYTVEWYSIDEARPDIKLAVEVDGCYWHSCNECGFDGPDETLTYDRKKESFLGTRGWEILRFWGHEIKESSDDCIDELKRKISYLEES